MVDYKKLLAKYIKMILMEESVHYLKYNTDLYSNEELDALNGVLVELGCDEVTKQKNN